MRTDRTAAAAASKGTTLLDFPSEKQTFVLRRDGDSPLAFEGRQMAAAPDRIKKNDEVRWHELELYETTGGKWILRLASVTTWKGEASRSTVHVLEAAADARQILRSYDPTKAFAGFPPGTQYEEKQRRLQDDVRARYDAQVADLLGKFPEVIS